MAHDDFTPRFMSRPVQNPKRRRAPDVDSFGLDHRRPTGILGAIGRGGGSKPAKLQVEFARLARDILSEYGFVSGRQVQAVRTPPKL
jgi:hypothetical protein